MVVSFSDDDSNNVVAITKAMLNLLAKQYPDACLRVYNTSNPKNVIVNNLTPPCTTLRDDVIPDSYKRVNSF